MNKLLKTHTLAAICGLAMLASSCSDDDVVDNGGSTNGGVTEQTNVEIESVDSIDLYKYWTEVLKDAQQGNSEEDSAEVAEATRQLAAMDSMAVAYLDSIGGNADAEEWKHGDDGEEGKFSWWCMMLYNIRYQSIDENGSPITLSELLVVPKNKFWGCVPNDYVLYCHSTLYNNADRPTTFYSRENNKNETLLKEWEKVARTTSSEAWHTEGIGVIPDFEGFGASSGRNYPCMNLDVLARQAVDGLVAAKKAVTENKLATMEDKWTSAIWGYGEGASIAAVAHIYMENNKDSDGKTLAEAYNFKGSDLIDGIYDPADMYFSAYDDYFDYQKTREAFDPFLLTYMIKAMCEYDPNLKGKYTVEDFLTTEYLNTGIVDFLNRKNRNLDAFIDDLFAKAWKGDFNVYVPYFYDPPALGVVGGYAYELYEEATYNRMKDNEDLGFRHYSSYSYKTDNRSYNTPGETVKEIYVRDEEPHDMYLSIADMLRDDYAIYYCRTGKNMTNEGYMERTKALLKAFDNQNLCKRSWNPKYPVYISYSNHANALRPYQSNVEKLRAVLGSNKNVTFQDPKTYCFQKRDITDYSSLSKVR